MNQVYMTCYFVNRRKYLWVMDHPPLVGPGTGHLPTVHLESSRVEFTFCSVH